MRVIGSRPERWLEWSCALALGLVALLAGCSTSNNIVYGTPVITIGDVSGDFTSYIVTIDAITFTRTDGLLVEPLSTPEQVDLARLTNLTELFETPPFPYGTYTSMALTLDYTAPDITLNVDGHATVVAPYDATNAPMLSATVTVNFDPQHPLVISPHASTPVAIDIDLAAMNSIDASASPIRTIVQPFLTATVLPVAETGPLRARGLVVIAQPSSSSYVMNVRPFADLVSALGALTVNTSPSTYFNVNGQVYVGAAGLQAMTATNIPNTPVVAYGTLDDLSGITPSFNATAVYLGTSEEDALADFLTGTVSAVSGDTLTIRGVSFLSRSGGMFYYDSIPVTLNADTPVYEDGVNAAGLTQASISVGQQVTVGGQANLNSTTGALESLTATGEGSLVRLQPTQLWGTLNSATTGSISLDLLSINTFEPADFNFAGTGSSTADDAVAASYLVDTGSLSETPLPAGTPLQVNGLVRPLRTAPPDFTATSVIQGSTVPATMVIEFGTNGAGVTEPFYRATSSGISVVLSRADSVHYIQTGPSKIDLTSLPQMPNIAYASGTTLVLAIGNDTSAIDVYNEPESFAEAIFSHLNGTNLFYRLVCVGQYDAATNTFVATRVDVALAEPVATG